MKLFLTSYLYESKQHLKEFLSGNGAVRRIGFIATASDVEEYKEHIYKAEEVFKELEMELVKLDISNLSSEASKAYIDELNCLYIAGGNTFYLLQELKKKNLIDYLKQRISSGLLYIGESAGAMLTAGDIGYVRFLDDMSLADDLKSTSSLSLVDFYVLPHYLEYPFEEATTKTLFEYGESINLIPINNKQSVVVEDADFIIKTAKHPL